jgi:hypothetical protein
MRDPSSGNYMNRFGGRYISVDTEFTRFITEREIPLRLAIIREIKQVRGNCGGLRRAAPPYH